MKTLKKIALPMRYYDNLLKNVNKLLAGLIQKEKVIAFCISNHLLSFLFNKVYFFPDTLQSQFLLNTRLGMNTICLPFHNL